MGFLSSSNKRTETNLYTDTIGSDNGSIATKGDVTILDGDAIAQSFKFSEQAFERVLNLAGRAYDSLDSINDGNITNQNSYKSAVADAYKESQGADKDIILYAGIGVVVVVMGALFIGKS